MNRIGSALLAAAAVLALAGCGGGSTPAGGSDPGIGLPEISGPAGGATPEIVFSTTLSSGGVEPTAALVIQVQAVCSKLVGGTDPAAVVQEFASQSGLDTAKVDYVLDAAVRAFCPDQQGALDSAG